MNKFVAARWVSLVVVGALAVGCGNRPDHAVAPGACASTLPVASATAPSTAPAAATLAAPVKAAPTSEAVAAKPQDAKVVKAASKSVEGAPLKVKRLVVAEGIEKSKREPIGEKTSFKASDFEKLYAFVEVENPEKADGTVFVTFEPQGDTSSHGQVELKVGAAPRWRTWAFTRNAKKPGKYAAIVRSADGTVLARAPFDVSL